MSLKPEILKGWGPGGWQFYEPATNWHAPLPLSNTFDQQVQNIIDMRKANPRFNLPTDKATVAADLEAYTEARWGKTYSKRGMVKFRVETTESKKNASNFTRVVSKAIKGAAALVGIDSSSLEDWLGSGGKAVDKDLAEKRAATCAPCPANKGNWRELLTLPASIEIRKYLEMKNAMKLETSLDEKLESCDVCHCVNSLKVWQPLRHILDNTTPEVMDAHAKANSNCWVTTEQNESRVP